MRCIVALGDSDSVKLEAETTGTVSKAEREDAAAKDGYDTDTTTLPEVAPINIDKTLLLTDASEPPETMENTVRGSAPIFVTAPLANVMDAASVHDVATPMPGEAAADAGAASRVAEHKIDVDTGKGSVTLTVPPPGGARSAQLGGSGVLMLTAIAEEE
jgi:hypothetical protein